MPFRWAYNYDRSAWSRPQDPRIIIMGSYRKDTLSNPLNKRGGD